MQARTLVYGQEQPIGPLEILDRRVPSEVKAIHTTLIESFRFRCGQHSVEFSIDTVELECDIPSIPKLSLSCWFILGY